MKRLILALAFAFAATTAVLSGPAAAETVRFKDHRTFPIHAGAKVTVDVGFYDVFVDVGPGDAVEVTVTLEARSSNRKRATEYLEDRKPTVETRGGDLVIRARTKTTWHLGFLSRGKVKAKGRIALTVPKGVHLNLDTASGDCNISGALGEADVNCDTASGDVTIRGTMRDLLVDTASGDLKASLGRPLRALKVDTASGDVSFRGGAEVVSIDTASGDVDVSGLTGSARFDTASGDVTASWSRVDENTEIRVDTASGGVELTLPEGAAVSGEVDTASGDIRSDFAGKPSDRGRHFTFAATRGDLALHIDTASGDVVLRRR